MAIKKFLPSRPGVYLFKNKSGNVIYIGKAINLRKRVQSYFRPVKPLDSRLLEMTARIKDVDFVITQSDFEALLLEAALIKKYQPKFNIQLKSGDKHFLYIKISTDEEFPKVTVSRKKDCQQKGVFFGPFPSAKKTRQVLKIIRQIFPFCSQRQLGKKACFYSHLGLCRPCPSEIIKFQGKTRERLKRKYLQNIHQIIKLLSGQSNKIITDLEKRMRKKAEQQKFEEAAELRDKILKLKYVLQPREKVGAYLENSSFLKTMYQKQIDSLFNFLKKHFDEKIAYPARIEGYDISDIFGKETTGAMVVFMDGDEEKKLYRRFKIKFKKTPHDVACLEEVFRRRLKHKEWPLPNLILVDGGVPQVGAFLKILKSKKLDLPVLGLAKKEEKVVVPGFKTLTLSDNSPVLKLLQRIRDEAHRFAQAYHLKLRLRNLIRARGLFES